MYKATLTSNQDSYQHKIYYGITKTTFKKRYENHKNPSCMKSTKATWKFLMNYGRSTATNTFQMLHGKYLENTSRVTLTAKRFYLCSKEKLEIGRYKGHNKEV